MKKKKDTFITVIKISGAVVCWLYLLVVIGIMPFYYTNGYARIGTDKAVLWEKYGFPVLKVGLFVLLIYYLANILSLLVKKEKENIRVWLKQEFSITDILILIYTLILLISYWSTDYKKVAWVGSEAWPMGLKTHLMVILSYFLISRFLVGNKYFLETVIKISGVVFLLAVLNRFNIWPLKMEYGTGSFISTIGNINWFCGYWSVFAWISVVQYWNRDYKSIKKEKWSAFYELFMSVLAIYTGIVQGSDSGLLAMVVVLMVLFWMSLENGDRMQRLLEVLFVTFVSCAIAMIINKVFNKPIIYPNKISDCLTRTVFSWICMVIVGLIFLWVRKKNRINSFKIVKIKLLKKVALIIGGICIIGYIGLLTFNTLMPGKLGFLEGKALFIYNDQWGASRGITWKAAFLTWWNQDFWHKLVGTGPDCMWSFIDGATIPSLTEMVRKVFRDQRLLNGHGEWITNLANLGVLGAFSYAALMITYVKRLFEKSKAIPLLYIFAICVLSYTVNNFFSFQTVVNLTAIFIIMGVGESFMRNRRR